MLNFEESETDHSFISKDDDKESDEDFIGMAGNLSCPIGSSSLLSFRGEWHYNASKQDFDRSVAATSNSSETAAASLEPVDAYKAFPFSYTCEQISRMWHPACVGYGFNNNPTEHAPNLEAERKAGIHAGLNPRDIDTSCISPIYLGVNAQRLCDLGSSKNEGRANKNKNTFEPPSPTPTPKQPPAIPGAAVLSTPNVDVAPTTTPAIAPTPATTPAITPITPRTPANHETSLGFSNHPLSQLFDSRACIDDVDWKHPPFVGLWTGEFILVPDAKSPSSNHKKQKKGKPKPKPKQMQIKEKFALYSSGPNPHTPTSGHGKNKFGNFQITTRWDGSSALTCEKVYVINNSKTDKNTPKKASRSPLFLAPPKALRKPSWQGNIVHGMVAVSLCMCHHPVVFMGSYWHFRKSKLDVFFGVLVSADVLANLKHHPLSAAKQCAYP